LYQQKSFEKDSKRKNSDRTVLVWSYTTGLSNAFDSILGSALFHQLIALDFPLSVVVYEYFFGVTDEQKSLFMVLVVTS